MRSRRRSPRACSSRNSAWAASGARSACSGKRLACIRPRSAMRAARPRTRRTKKSAAGSPTTPKRCWWCSTPRSSLTKSCSRCSGKPTTHAGHAPGQRRPPAVTPRRPPLPRCAGQGGRAVEATLRAGPESERLWSDYDGDPPGAGVLLRRGLSPAIPGEKSCRLLRPRRHRRFVPGRGSAQQLTTRRRFLALSALAAMAARVRAQTPRARIGVLDPSPFEDSVYANSVVQAFTERGYGEGVRATFLYRFAEGGFDQHREQARALAAQNCDVLVALRSEPTARALQSVRPAAPILFLAIDYHPLESGVVTSLRSPDRNTTGVFVPQNALVTRRVEILRQLLPQAKRLDRKSTRLNSSHGYSS